MDLFAAVAYSRFDRFVELIEVNRCFGAHRDELGNFGRQPVGRRLKALSRAGDLAIGAQPVYCPGPQELITFVASFVFHPCLLIGLNTAGFERLEICTESATMDTFDAFSPYRFLPPPGSEASRAGNPRRFLLCRRL
jgi:hypothetical protein